MDSGEEGPFLDSDSEYVPSSDGSLEAGRESLGKEQRNDIKLDNSQNSDSLSLKTTLKHDEMVVSASYKKCKKLFCKFCKKNLNKICKTSVGSS